VAGLGAASGQAGWLPWASSEAGIAQREVRAGAKYSLQGYAKDGFKRVRLIWKLTNRSNSSKGVKYSCERPSGIGLGRW
jgi:hypothetical protein